MKLSNILNAPNWFWKGFIPGLALMFIGKCSFFSSPQIELPTDLELEQKENTETSTKVCYSWSYQKIGDYWKGFLIFGRKKPLYSFQFKVALLSKDNHDIDIYIPVNGEVIDYDFPTNIDLQFEDTGKDKKERLESSLNILIKNVKPNQIINFTFSVRHEINKAPINPDGVSVFHGQGIPINWDNFKGDLEVQEKGFWKAFFSNNSSVSTRHSSLLSAL